MANTDKRNGFQPIYSSGRQMRRRIREVTVAGNPTNPLGPGDAYTIAADGTVIKATSATATVNGIVEAVVLKGINEGPVSFQFLPAATLGQVIGIEDPDAEFECTASSVLVLADYDSGARVALAAGTFDQTLSISRDAIGAINGSGPFNLVQPVDRVNNDQFLVFARVVVRIFNLVQ